MRITDQVRERVREFTRRMREEFGSLTVEGGLLLETAEDWGVLLGDALARTVTEQASPTAADTASCAVEAACPKCQRLGRWKGSRKRCIETRRGAIHVSEPEYYCHHCRRSFCPLARALGMGTDETLSVALLKKVVRRPTNLNGRRAQLRKWSLKP